MKQFAINLYLFIFKKLRMSRSLVKLLEKRWRDVCLELIGLKRKMKHLFVISWMSKSVERRYVVHSTLLRSIRGAIV